MVFMKLLSAVCLLFCLYIFLIYLLILKENWGERLTVTISITFLAMLMLACLLIMIKQAVFTAWPTKKKDHVDVLVLVCHSRIGHDQIPMYFPWQPIHFICGSSVLFSRKLEKNSFLKLWPSCILGSCWYLLTGECSVKQVLGGPRSFIVLLHLRQIFFQEIHEGFFFTSFMEMFHKDTC